jgi:hypothetical protein
MKSPKLAITLFLLAYLIATVVGFSTYHIHVAVMWITLFTLMPVVFGYFFYSYLRMTGCERSQSFRETNLLILFWIALSFLADGLVYVVGVPVIFGSRSNWTFFLDQSPWIWLNYLTIVMLGHISRAVYVQRLTRAPVDD